MSILFLNVEKFPKLCPSSILMLSFLSGTMDSLSVTGFLGFYGNKGPAKEHYTFSSLKFLCSTFICETCSLPVETVIIEPMVWPRDFFHKWCYPEI